MEHDKIDKYLEDTTDGEVERELLIMGQTAASIAVSVSSEVDGLADLSLQERAEGNEVRAGRDEGAVVLMVEGKIVVSEVTSLGDSGLQKLPAPADIQKDLYALVTGN